MLIPGIFTKAGVIDMITGVMPAIFVLSAYTVNYVIRNWFRTFPFNKKARSVMIVMFSAFFALALIFNYQKYFVAWANNDQVKNEYNQSLDLDLSED